MNGKYVSTGVPQGSVLGLLCFLVYINDLAEGLVSDIRLFAGDIPLFSVVCDEQVSADILNADLKFIETLTYQWKMRFNPYRNKQAIQVIFVQKNKPIHHSLIFNRSEVTTLDDEHKHLGFLFDSKLSFLRHIKEILIKACRGVVVQSI